MINCKNTVMTHQAATFQSKCYC